MLIEEPIVHYPIGKRHEFYDFTGTWQVVMPRAMGFVVVYKGQMILGEKTVGEGGRANVVFEGKAVTISGRQCSGFLWLWSEETLPYRRQLWKKWMAKGVGDVKKVEHVDEEALFVELIKCYAPRCSEQLPLMMDMLVPVLSPYIPDMKELGLWFQADVFRVRREFLEVYDMPFYQYAKSHRMKMGEELLRHTTRRIQDIAKFCGYRQSSKFIQSFREAYEMTPLDYRRQLRRK